MLKTSDTKKTHAAYWLVVWSLVRAKVLPQWELDQLGPEPFGLWADKQRYLMPPSNCS